MLNSLIFGAQTQESREEIYLSHTQYSFCHLCDLTPLCWIVTDNDAAQSFPSSFKTGQNKVTLSE